MSTPTSDVAGALPGVTPHAIRDELTEMVVRDLLGPAGGPTEELDQREDRVTGRYLLGMLAPKATPVEASAQDALGTDNADDPEVGASDRSATSSDTFFPNSVGVSFLVESAAKAILVKTDWGRYRREKSTTQINKKTGAEAMVWMRTPLVGEPLHIPLKDGVFGPLLPRPDTDSAVVVQGKVRKTPRGWVVTVFLVNKRPEQERRRDEAWVFQPRLSVLDAATPPRAVFCQHKDWRHDLNNMDPISREESETLEMLYRHRLEFSVGHGVSVHVTLPEPEATQAMLLETTFVPQSEVAQQTAPSREDDAALGGAELDMKVLAEMPKQELLASLRQMGTAYIDWIQREAAKIDVPKERLSDHQTAAARAVQRCQRASSRISEGIDLIENDAKAEQAFRFANRAMWRQRVHSTYARKVRKKELATGEPVDQLDTPRNRSWRLFQLAFDQPYNRPRRRRVSFRTLFRPFLLLLMHLSKHRPIDSTFLLAHGYPFQIVS
jgi:hypothetical protein